MNFLIFLSFSLVVVPKEAHTHTQAQGTGVSEEKNLIDIFRLLGGIVKERRNTIERDCKGETNEEDELLEVEEAQVVVVRGGCE